MADHSSGDYQRAIVTLEISSEAELSSAQQRMRVLAVSRVHLQSFDRCNGDGTDADKDGGHRHQWRGVEQRQSKVISFPIRWNESCTQRSPEARGQCSASSTRPPSTLVRLLMALRRGKNRLVMREWRQGACWWNLNMNNDVESATHYGDPNESSTTSIIRGTAHPHNFITPNNENANASDMTLAYETQARQTTVSMARAEVAGYRLSRLAMNYYSNDQQLSRTDLELGEQKRLSDGKNDQGENHSQNCNVGIGKPSSGEATLFMPEVLHFSHDDLQINKINDYVGNQCGGNNIQCVGPWALLSYFDNEIHDFETDVPSLMLDIDDGFGFNFDWDEILNNSQTNGIVQTDSMHHTTIQHRKRKPCHHYPTTMIKVRHEFGFDEPHPRHGRVPLDECLDYGRMILRDVILPIQTSFFKWWAECDLGDSNHSDNVMQHLLSIGWHNNKQNQRAEPFQYHDMIKVYRSALHRLSQAGGVSNTSGNADGRMIFLLEMLDKCVHALSCEWEEYGGKPPALPPVLCHMDLQPQNLAFWRVGYEDNCNNNEVQNGHCIRNNKNSSNYDANSSSVASVMDWEEACYADPRFELLLVCRKVLANRDQSKILWQSYSHQVQRLGSLLSTQLSNGKCMTWEVGPLEPWLKLETVHSLCTLLLQAMDLLGGGRSPWETKPDLWGKIDRERLRLVRMGWVFCNFAEEKVGTVE